MNKPLLPGTKPSFAYRLGRKLRSLLTFSGKPAFWRFKLAKKISSWLLGREMFISPFKKGTLTATAVFWFVDDGVRKFLMVRPTVKKDQPVQFISCLDMHNNEPVTLTLQRTVGQVLGKAFAKSLGRQPFEADNISCAPSFSYKDARSGMDVPVQNLTWVTQITPEQAELSMPSMPGIEVVSVPEHILSSNEVLEPHKIIFQTAHKQIYKATPALEKAVMEEIEDHLRTIYGGSKTIH
jgi:hypothetical protein